MILRIIGGLVLVGIARKVIWRTLKYALILAFLIFVIHAVGGR